MLKSMLLYVILIPKINKIIPIKKERSINIKESLLWAIHHFGFFSYCSSRYPVVIREHEINNNIPGIQIIIDSYPKIFPKKNWKIMCITKIIIPICAINR